jgi:signal transduction histidine kinase
MLTLMKGSGMWLSRRQMRWLVILLALLPMVPAIMTMRLTLDGARRDRDEAVEQETQIYRDQLIHLVNRTSSNTEAEGEGSVLFAQLQRIFGDGATLILRNPDRKPIWKQGHDAGEDAIIVEIREGSYAGWTVILDQIVDLPDYIGEQMLYAWLRAAAWAVGVALVAAIVWFAVHRGLQVDELRGDLLTTVSHEIRTPLASMRVLLETLTDDDADLVLKSEATRREYLHMVSGEVQRLTRLSDDFLAFSRLERGEHRCKKASCDLCSIVHDVLAGLADSTSRAHADIQLSLNSDPAWGDPDAIATVLRNLIENALKYGASPDGRVALRIASIQNPRPDRIWLEVADSGAGVAPEFREAVFRRYFRVDQRLSGSGSGVGLGLSICRHLVRKMNGRILLTETPGGGCRFLISLPKSPDKPFTVGDIPVQDTPPLHSALST